MSDLSTAAIALWATAGLGFVAISFNVATDLSSRGVPLRRAPLWVRVGVFVPLLGLFLFMLWPLYEWLGWVKP